MKSPRRRFRLFTDWDIQGKILVRVGVAWMACQFIMVATILGFLALEGTDASQVTATSSHWRFLVPAIVASSVVFPIVMLDMLVFTNKFTGPLRRFRSQLQSLAEGKPVSALHFRPGDLVTDLSVNFNEIQTALDNAKRNFVSDDDNYLEQIPQTIGGRSLH